MPLILFPFALNGLAEATVSFGRISKFLTAEELAEPYRIDPALDPAFKVDGEFEWEAVAKLEETSEKLNKMAKVVEKEEAEKKTAKGKPKSGDKSGWWKRQEKDDIQDEILPSTISDATPQDPPAVEDDPPFALKDLKLEVRRGTFVAIVGRVGSGKVYSPLPVFSVYFNVSLIRALSCKH